MYTILKVIATKTDHIVCAIKPQSADACFVIRSGGGIDQPSPASPIMVIMFTVHELHAQCHLAHQQLASLQLSQLVPTCNSCCCYGTHIVIWLVSDSPRLQLNQPLPTVKINYCCVGQEGLSALLWRC